MIPINIGEVCVISLVRRYPHRVEQAVSRRGDDWPYRDRQITYADEKRSQYRLHALRILFLERLGCHSINVLITRVNCTKPSFDTLRKRELLKRTRQFHTAGDRYLSLKFGIIRVFFAAPGQRLRYIAIDHGQGSLRKVAEAVGQLRIGAIDDRLGTVAAVLPERDFAQQEVAQRVDPEMLGKHHGINDIADALRHLLTPAEEEAVAVNLPRQLEASAHQEGRPIDS